MPKQTSAQPEPEPIPTKLPRIIVTDYLPANFSIPIPEDPSFNFLDEHGGIKRPPNSWICYRSESTRFMREYHTIDERGNEKFLEQGLVSRLCSQMWNTMSEDAKAPWVAHAARLAAEHKRQYPNYIFAPKSKLQKEQEKNAGKPAGNPTKRVPSKSTPRAKAAPYPRRATVSRLSPPTLTVGSSQLPNAPATYQPLPYIPPPTTDLSSNPYAVLLPYPVMPSFKPFSVPLPLPPITASPSMSDYTPSPGTTDVLTPEPTMVEFDVQPEGDQPDLFDWEMNEFFMSLAQADVPSYSSDVMSGEPSLPAQGASGILPVLSLEAEPGMSVAVGNLPGQEAAHLFAQEPAAIVPLTTGTFDPQNMPDLQHDWMNHLSLQGDLVSLQSNEIWPGGEWLWGTVDPSAVGFSGQSVDHHQQPMPDAQNATGMDPWYQMQGQVTDEPVGWSMDSVMQSQDNYGMEAGYLDQGQLDDGAQLDGYYTNDTMPSTTYVPPTGAAFSSNRRVGGTWQLHSQS